MSGFSDGVPCPNCGREADRYTDYKPFDYTTITCIHCGLKITPKIEYMTLKELNQQRLDCDMEKIERTKRPPQNYDLWD